MFRCSRLILRAPQYVFKARSYCSSTSSIIPVDISRFTPENTRNFCIIAHIDHGKTTLSDRLMEATGAIATAEISERVLTLDKLQVEKERGITVKAQTCSMVYNYTDENNEEKELLYNLVDTPGHVDFSYEVSRALAICQTAILLVDFQKGIQAQTLSNLMLAYDAGLDIIPVVNKVDLAPDEGSVVELENSIRGILLDDSVSMTRVSAKTGKGVPELLSKIRNVRPPDSRVDRPLKAVLFDSWFESHRGVICLVSVIDGRLKAGEIVQSAYSNMSYTVTHVGILNPGVTYVQSISAGQVGFMITGMKSRSEAKIGDTFFHQGQEVEPMPGFKDMRPMVFSGIYPVMPDQFAELKNAFEKLTLNDAGVTFYEENNACLGNGFRCGFLGLLHMEVFIQRLDQEFDVPVISTSPSVTYKVIQKGGEQKEISNPQDFPEHYQKCLQPIVRANIVAPTEYYGEILNICKDVNGEQEAIEQIDATRTRFTYIIPLSEVIVDFYDNLKKATAGHASFDYEDAGYDEANQVKVDILVNGESIPPLSCICREDNVDKIGRAMVEKLKQKLSRQLFVIPIQASVGNKVIARATLSALRKDVTAKCYGGDITRKRKLLDKQKEGKKRMRQFGSVEIPIDVLHSLLRK